MIRHHPAPIPDKVRRIIPTLGSPVDGEALGAARAIGRVLESAGLGFCDLAAAIPAGPRPSRITQPMPAAPRPGSRAGPIPPFNLYAFRRAYTPRQEAQHRERVAFCQSRPWKLSPWEREFLENVARLHGNLTIRQGDRLAALTDRLEQEERRA